MSEPATDEQIAEITERLANATPGPWEHVLRRCSNDVEAPNAGHVCTPETHDDAVFIAAAPSDIASLLARIAAQDAARVADGVRIAELEAEVARLTRDLNHEKTKDRTAWEEGGWR